VATATETPAPPATGNSTGSDTAAVATDLATRITLAPIDLLLALLAIGLAVAAGWLWMRGAHVPLDMLRWGLGALLGTLAIYIVVGMGWLNFENWLSPNVTAVGLRAIFTGLMLVGGLIAAVGFGFSTGAINRRK